MQNGRTSGGQDGLCAPASTWRQLSLHCCTCLASLHPYTCPLASSYNQHGLLVHWSHSSPQTPSALSPGADPPLSGVSLCPRVCAQRLQKGCCCKPGYWGHEFAWHREDLGTTTSPCRQRLGLRVRKKWVGPCFTCFRDKHWDELQQAWGPGSAPLPSVLLLIPRGRGFPPYLVTFPSQD